MNAIITRINRAILDSSLSYRELSEITGISKSALQRYANGDTEKIPIDVIEKIANATNVTAAYIMGWTEKKPATDEGDGLDEDIREINSILDRLGPDERKEVLKFAKFQENEQNQ